MSDIFANPFQAGDPDRREILQMLVESDFAAEHFVGYSCSSNPNHWRITYPTLDSYRNEWLRQ